MVAGVFSRCMLVKHLNSHYRVETDCCHDPAVYERINEEIKHWIWKKAPGVRDSRGCTKKEVKSMKIIVYNIKYFDIFLDVFYPSFLFKAERKQLSQLEPLQTADVVLNGL